MTAPTATGTARAKAEYSISADASKTPSGKTAKKPLPRVELPTAFTEAFYQAEREWEMLNWRENGADGQT